MEHVLYITLQKEICHMLKNLLNLIDINMEIFWFLSSEINLTSVEKFEW